MTAELEQKIAEQAAVIEKLRYAMQQEINHHFLQVGPKDLPNLKKALLIPTDSKQVLQEWLDKVLGEPIMWINAKGEPWGYGEIRENLFKKPEVK